MVTENRQRFRACFSVEVSRGGNCFRVSARQVRPLLGAKRSLWRGRVDPCQADLRDSPGAFGDLGESGLDTKRTQRQMTYSEKSHIRRMKAWPYRQECRGHDPTKKNLFC